MSLRSRFDCASLGPGSPCRAAPGAAFSGVGLTEPPKSGRAGFAGAGAEISGVGLTEPSKSGRAGFAGAGAETTRP